jgi:general stress protein YciG
MGRKRKLKGKRGFASMSPEKRKLIASFGGRQAHLLGRAHTFTPEEASAAGKIGGKRSRTPKRKGIFL